MKKTMWTIVKWVVLTPVILLAGCLQLEDLALLFTNMRQNDQQAGDDILAQIEGIRS